ncbi:hypothetical protein AgCh_002177 [Apium graveolens]
MSGGNDEGLLDLERVSVVTGDHNSELIAPITTDEVKMTVFSMYPEKSPIADGLNPAFFQTYWNIVADDLTKFCQNFLTTEEIPAGICDEIERLKNEFWWGKGSTGRGIKWSSWEDLSLPKYGGIGSKKSKIEQNMKVNRFKILEESSIKIPIFDKANYTLWKKKMMLFIRMAIPLYIQILKNGPFTPVVRVEKSIDGDMVIPAHYAPKDPSEYTEPEKEKVSLDSSLQLILIESLDNVMYNKLVKCDTAKQIWEKIEIFSEETEEVRYNKLINDLQLHDKYYEAEEVNLKFLLTLPDHLKQKISAIREGRELSRIILEVLYGILKTYKLEIIQRKLLRSGQGHVVDGSSALIVNESQISTDEPRSQIPVASTSEQRINDSQEQVILELEKDVFYTLEELNKLDQSMAYLARKFSNIRVKKPRYFKIKGKSKIRCFNCDELGHFATECRKPKKGKKDKAYLELEAKYEALLKKQLSKAYIAEDKSWDDSKNDEDEEFGNYALMAFEQGESSSSKS